MTSDFYLTDQKFEIIEEMALAGKWNKARNENGEAFLTALGVDKAALDRAANAACGKS